MDHLQLFFFYIIMLSNLKWKMGQIFVVLLKNFKNSITHLTIATMSKKYRQENCTKKSATQLLPDASWIHKKPHSKAWPSMHSSFTNLNLWHFKCTEIIKLFSNLFYYLNFPRFLKLLSTLVDSSLMQLAVLNLLF